MARALFCGRRNTRAVSDYPRQPPTLAACTARLSTVIWRALSLPVGSSSILIRASALRLERMGMQSLEPKQRKERHQETTPKTTQETTMQERDNRRRRRQKQ